MSFDPFSLPGGEDGEGGGGRGEVGGLLFLSLCGKIPGNKGAKTGGEGGCVLFAGFSSLFSTVFHHAGYIRCNEIFHLKQPSAEIFYLQYFLLIRP